MIEPDSFLKNYLRFVSIFVLPIFCFCSFLNSVSIKQSIFPKKNIYIVKSENFSDFSDLGRKVIMAVRPKIHTFFSRKISRGCQLTKRQFAHEQLKILFSRILS